MFILKTPEIVSHPWKAVIPFLWQGVPGNLIEREVEQALKEVFLTEKGDTKAADLSGNY